VRNFSGSARNFSRQPRNKSKPSSQRVRVCASPWQDSQSSRKRDPAQPAREPTASDTTFSLADARQPPERRLVHCRDCPDETNCHSNLDESSPTLVTSAVPALRTCLPLSLVIPTRRQPESNLLPHATRTTPSSLGLINQSDAILDSPTTTLRLLYLGFVRKSQKEEEPDDLPGCRLPLRCRPRRASHASHRRYAWKSTACAMWSSTKKTAQCASNSTPLVSPQDAIAKLLRQAGIDVRDKLALA